MSLVRTRTLVNTSMTYYTVYKVTNKRNGKFYIGTHKTKNLDDNYMGSGKYLRAAIKKDGVENFEKEILFVFDNPADMYDKEAEIVNEDFLVEQNTYNLRVGGFGGFDYINTNLDLSELRKSNGRKVSPEVRSRNGKKSAQRNHKKWREDPTTRPFTFTKERNAEYSQRALTEEALSKRRETYKRIRHQQGEKNSQFGTCWIYNEMQQVSMKIKKGEVGRYLDEGWLPGRKFFRSRKK